MKRAYTVLLTAVLCLSLTLPALSAGEEQTSPVTLFSGPVVLDGVETVLPLNRT